MISIYQIEVWKDIPEFNGAIQISTLGEVRYTCNHWYSGKNHNVLKYRNPVIKGKIDKDGYPVVHIRINNKTKYRSIHRLSCLTFHPNPENKPQVNHKDLNKLNTYFMNYEWNTAGENVRHSLANQTIKRNPPRGIKQPKAKLNDEMVRKIRNSGLSSRKLGKQFGISSGIICDIKNGKMWAHVV